MHEKAVNASVSVNKWMHKDEPESSGSSKTYGMNTAACLQQTAHHLHPASQQRGDILWPWTDEMNVLGIVGQCSTDIDLDVSPIFLRVSRIDDHIL